MKPLYVKLPKMSGYAKYFNKTKHMNFLMKDRDLLEAENKIWERDITLIKKYLIMNQCIIKNI